MLELIDGLPDAVVEIEAVGTVTLEDYRRIAIPAIERACERHENAIKLLDALNASEFIDFSEPSHSVGSGSARKVLAPQLELCSPRLIASRANARWRPSGFRPGFWPQGQSKQSTPLSACRAKGA